MITVSRAPAWLVVQDQGWSGQRAIGLPPGGAMDRHALAVANLLVGNAIGDAGLEWALGPGTIRFEEPVLFALSGAAARATIGGRPVAMHATSAAAAGEELQVTELAGGRFLFVAIRGGLDVPLVLGSRSTYLRGGFGGLHGRRVHTGDFIPLGVPAGPPPPSGFQVPEPLAPDYRSRELRIVEGPQAELFDPAERAKLVESAWVVAAASDRMGYRLKGATIVPRVAATLASEAACPGAVQVPGEGAPIVLMVDGPTVGGYPKLAVICGADLPLLAQRQPGDQVTFRWISLSEAQRLHRRRTIQLHTLASLITDAAGA